MERTIDYATDYEEFSGTHDEFALIGKAIELARLHQPRKNYEYTRISKAVASILGGSEENLKLRGDDAHEVVSAVHALAVHVKTYEVVSDQNSPLSPGLESLVSDIVPKPPADLL